MINDQRSTGSGSRRDAHGHSHGHDHDHHDDDGHESPSSLSSPIIRDIHALTPPITSAHVSSSLSIASSSSNDVPENFTTISREFNALVLAGSTIRPENPPAPNNLGRIGEDQTSVEETNPLAIVLDRNPLQSPRRETAVTTAAATGGGGELAVQSVKKEEAESKINAWANAKIAKVNNRFKREEAVIRSWEDDKVHKAMSWMKKIERKLEEKRAKALEKMQNDIAKARRKAEEKKATAEAQRGVKVARLLEIANFMRAMGKPPSKRSFF